MKRLLLLSLLFLGCNNPNNHGNLSIFKTPTPEQFNKWVEVDSSYINMVSPMVDVYKGSAKLNFNGNPWINKEFQSEYSDLTWRELFKLSKIYSLISNIHLGIQAPFLR